MLARFDNNEKLNTTPFSNKKVYEKLLYKNRFHSIKSRICSSEHLNIPAKLIDLLMIKLNSKSSIKLFHQTVLVKLFATTRNREMSSRRII